MLRPVLFALALTASGLAAGQPPDGTERIARLSYVQGMISYREADQAAAAGLPDGPLAAGDRLDTGREGRAELSLGTATLRLAEATRLTIATLDRSAVRFDLESGSASLHLRELVGGESLAIATPATTVSFTEPGEYRVDQLAAGTTEITVRAGAAEVLTPDGAVRVAGGQRVQVAGRDALVNLGPPRPADEFDEWVLEREVSLAELAPLPSTESEYYGDGALDDYGEWHDDARYGRVWMPGYAYGGYDPFASGYWLRSGYGWSWYDPMPWSPYTYHYGQWAYLDHLGRWGWVAQRHRNRVGRSARDLERELAERDDDRRTTTHPMGRPRADEDLARRAGAASSGLGRAFDADRRPPVNRVESDSPSTPSASAAQRNAAAAARAAAARSSAASGSTMQPSRSSGGSSGATMQPSRSSSVSSSQSSRPSSQPSVRPSSPPPSTNKSFGRPQDP